MLRERIGRVGRSAADEKAMSGICNEHSTSRPGDIPAASMARDRVKVAGFIYSLSAFFMWGLLPIYWKLLKHVSPFEVLSHRIIWCFVFVVSVLICRKRRPASKLFSKRDLCLLFTTGTLVGLNWLVYIIAVNSDRILEASMGYYINPLLSIFLGMAVLKERLQKVQLAAFGLAIAGVLYIAIDYGKFPWIALSLASLFALYGLLKKISRHDPIQALGMETLLLSPFALGFMIFSGSSGSGAFVSGGAATTLLLILSGSITALPLYWFAEGAARIHLSSVGFIQYVTPSMMLLIGIFVYGEDFTRAHMVSFSLIWIALALYSISVWRGSGSGRSGLHDEDIVIGRARERLSPESDSAHEFSRREHISRSVGAQAECGLGVRIPEMLAPEMSAAVPTAIRSRPPCEDFAAGDHKEATSHRSIPYIESRDGHIQEEEENESEGLTSHRCSDAHTHWIRILPGTDR